MNSHRPKRGPFDKLIKYSISFYLENAGKALKYFNQNISHKQIERFLIRISSSNYIIQIPNLIVLFVTFLG